ncbi:porin [Paraburkholderia silvatlantica]|uniref:GBP family porin n=1 Tax=Paraburkholderia silvatlantica TaxID=321895 RepID=A0A2U0ZU29_9BURK|nr:porin [Paraburkholderia silvatlantica]MBB2930115.1 GBP family porin [Paraburkholderia silvatlantica]PVY22456.1 GBP family porin [Paraburkholderia silvatlantica]PXW28925.1 GBP family porin [Paraburkholderia silvatlantica]PYE23816.1 GBP family porin [Paraburkholderia silvatlantica]TDR04383.1 GBP family porin [Paraburkholderia silvatlantica]
MKKTLMVAALTGVFATAAHAQSSVTLYGLIDAGITYSNNQRVNATSGHSAWQATSGTINGSRWGLRGAEDLGGGLKAIFTLENGFNIDNGNLGQKGRMFGRQAFVGLASDQYGAVTLGRQYDSVVDYLAPLSNTGTQYGGTIAAHPFDNDNLNNSVRFNNTVKYSSVNYAGFKFGGTYSFSNSTQFANNRAYSFGATYNYAGLNFAAAYLHANNDINNQQFNAATFSGAQAGDYTFGAARQSTFGGGVNYTFGPATAGFVYTQTQLGNAIGISPTQSGTANGINLHGNSVRFQNFEGNIRYALTPALSLAGAYTYTRTNFGGGVNPNYNTVSLQSDYALSKRTDVYLQGNWQHVSSNSANIGPYLNGLTSASATQDQVAVTVGMRHRF